MTSNGVNINLQCISIFQWKCKTDKKFNSVIFLSCMCTGDGTGVPERLLCCDRLLTLHTCACVSLYVCVCLTEHQEAIWATATFTICHIPSFLSSRLTPLYIHYIPSVFHLPCIILLSNKHLYNHPYCCSVFLIAAFSNLFPLSPSIFLLNK